MYALIILGLVQVIGRFAIDADRVSAGAFSADSIRADRIVTIVITNTSLLLPTEIVPSRTASADSVGKGRHIDASLLNPVEWSRTSSALTHE